MAGVFWTAIEESARAQFTCSTLRETYAGTLSLLIRINISADCRVRDRLRRPHYQFFGVSNRLPGLPSMIAGEENFDRVVEAI
jgi:hypothetical protein